MEDISFIAETERLVLRRYAEKHPNDFYEYVSDPEVVKYEPYKPMTLDEASQNFEWRMSNRRDDCRRAKGQRKADRQCIIYGKAEFQLARAWLCF